MSDGSKKKKGDVVIFFTGGTICMRPIAKDRGVVPSGDFDRFFSELRPHIENVGVKPIRWSDLPSPHMTPNHMFRLACDVDKALADPSVLGAVVIHGTDVLVESAFMAELTVRSDKPVVFTGSMRFYSETGYDGIRNLINGIKACIKPMPPIIGVALLMNDRFFSARDVVKINSLNVDAFEAPESGPMGYVAGDKILMTYNLSKALKLKRKIIKTERIELNVPLVTCYTGMDDTIIKHLSYCNISGLVIEGFGAGNVPPSIVPSLESLLKNDIPVVLTTACIEGGVWPIYAYPGGGADLKEKGIIMGGRLSGPKARIQLMLALGRTRKIKEIRRIFEEF